MEPRLAFLLRASELLGESLDYEETLRRVADLAVPDVADWCSVDLIDDDGSIDQVAVAHVDPEKVALAREMRRRYPPDTAATSGIANVIRTGRSELYEAITDEVLEATVPDDQRELLELVRRLGLVSAMTVPLIAHERVLGAITLVTAESGHRYDRHRQRSPLRSAGTGRVAQRGAVPPPGRQRARLRDLHARHRWQRDDLE
jgi:GAF domain-containing protein